MVDSLEVSSYQFDVINHVSQSDSFADPVIIHGFKNPQVSATLLVPEENGRKTPALIERIDAKLFNILSRIIQKIEFGPVRRGSPNYFRSHSLSEVSGVNLLSVNASGSSNDSLAELSDSDLERIKNQALDCIVYFAGDNLKGDILNKCKIGVLALCLGDNRAYRGGPAGFWEVLSNEPSTGFTIQKINNDALANDVLIRGNIMSWNNWTANHAALLAKSTFFVKKLLDDIATRGQLPKLDCAAVHAGQREHLRKSSTLLRYLLTILVPVVGGKLIEKFLSPKVGRWKLAYAKQDNFKTSLSDFKEIDNPKTRFLADPFVFTHNGKHVIFAEDLFYSDNKGRISALEVDGTTETFLGVVLEEDFHLSYPFVFEEAGKVYMIPETNEANEIRLYESTNFPMQWELKEVLMENVSAADTLIFRQSGTWYLLTNICSARVGDHKSELHIFYADSLHTKDWKPIACGNPVIFDSARARNGGFFKFDGGIYRINQIHGKAHYGKAFGVNRIDQLDTENYRETRIKTVNASVKDGGVSAHHFHANDEFAVYDFGREARLKQILKER